MPDRKAILRMLLGLWPLLALPQLAAVGGAGPGRVPAHTLAVREVARHAGPATPRLDAAPSPDALPGLNDPAADDPEGQEPAGPPAPPCIAAPAPAPLGEASDRRPILPCQIPSPYPLRC